MFKFNYILLISFTLTIFGCIDDDFLPYEYQDAQSLTSAFNDDIKPLLINRLLFAKALSKALNHIELRDYINKLSRDNTTNTFNEIIFALHKDDVIKDGRKFKDYIEQEVDDEITSIYGKDFLNKIQEQDPMLAIKLPDIFYLFNWDIYKFSPFVYAKTIFPIGNDENGPFYMGYHCSGLQDKLYKLRKVNKFSLVVKYSEDYLLIDIENLVNHKKIPLINIFPQYTPFVWNNLKETILSKSYKSPTGDNKYYVKKRLLFDLFKNIEKKDYVNYIDTTTCEKQCVRNCFNQDSSYNKILSLKFISFDLMTVFQGNTFILNDNIDLFMLYNSFLGENKVEVVNRFFITGFRRDEYMKRNINIVLRLISEKYEKIGEILIPYLDINIEILEFNEIQLNHLLEKGWNSLQNKDRDMEFFLIQRDEIVYKYRIGIGKLNDISDEYFFDYEQLGNEYFRYCTPPVDYFPFGGLIAINYK